MGKNHRPGFVERMAEALGIIPELQDASPDHRPQPLNPEGDLTRYPPPEKWDDWVEYEATGWPEGKSRRYTIVPTACFNCEAGCGLLSYIDKETEEVRKFEGNPWHPGSRGKNCAKGPATINQIEDPDRILYPLRRKGKRGDGGWERISWDQALDEIAGRIRKALQEGRNNEVVYHVGRPGHEGYIERILKSWNVDGHNSHTNICSSGARLGYAIWQGADRPSPDYAGAKFILLISAHLESGHYFNPHAQRIIEAKMAGAKIAVMDPRLSNTASMADFWMPTHPGSEAAVLLAISKILLEEGRYNREFLEGWVNWQEMLEKEHPGLPRTFETFVKFLKEEHAPYTPEFAERESGVPAAKIVEVARAIGEAGTRVATHSWRSSASGNLGGWSVARCLQWINVLTGGVGAEGGTLPNSWNKFVPKVFDDPPAQKFWNELHFPKEYPLSHYEMSFLLPYFLKEGRGRLDTYFTRVFNPVWTYPDGMSWVEMLTDEEKLGAHVALTPTWSETAYFADYVLPMGHASERHDLISYETHAGTWIAFRQPVLREARRRQGRPVTFTYESNPGEVWEEDEFWIELSWRIDPDGSLGIRKHFLSPYREGQKITIDEYYRFLFEHVKGLPEHAAGAGLSALDYMRKFGAYEVEKKTYSKHMDVIPPAEMEGTEVDASGLVKKQGKAIGVMVGGAPRRGFNTPSRRQEYYSSTLAAWGWPEYKLPTYVKSHIHPATMDLAKGEMVLVPTFRLPTLIHSRSGNAKWLYEISNRNPLWMSPEDARRLGVDTGDTVRVSTEIGHYVDKVWVTEGIKPGVVACSHHLGRWRRSQDPVGNRWASNLVKLERSPDSIWKMRQIQPVGASTSDDPDSERIFWNDGGVHQNMTFPVHPDPVSGMHCWHQKVVVEKARPEDVYGDVTVDTAKSYALYKEWLKLARPGPGPGGLRRPLWLKRPLPPAPELFYEK